MRTRWIIVSFAAVLTLLAGSCSSGSSDKSATTDSVESTAGSGKKSTTGGGSPKVPKDLCELLPQKDAEAAIGGTKLEKNTYLRDDACDYSGADPSDMVTVSLEYGPDGLKGMKLKNLADTLADEDAGVTKVDGVGDEAYAVKVISNDTLLVAVGDDLLTITLADTSGDNVKAMTTLAKQAVEKL